MNDANKTSVFSRSSDNFSKCITACRFGTLFKLGDEPYIYLHLKLKRGEPETIIYILIDELLRMTDFNKVYRLSCGFDFKPADFNNSVKVGGKNSNTFKEIVCRLIPYLYRKGYVAPDEYREFAIKFYSQHCLAGCSDDLQGVYQFYKDFIHNTLEIREVGCDGMVVDWMRTSEFFQAVPNKAIPKPDDVYHFLNDILDLIYISEEKKSYKQWLSTNAFEKRMLQFSSQRTAHAVYNYGNAFMYLLRHFLKIFK